MFNYRTEYAISPWAIAVDLQLTPAPPPAPSGGSTPWQWCYQFNDGSQLRGHCWGWGPTDSPGLAPSERLPTVHIQRVGMTEYLAADGNTPLLQWQPAQFICYELGEDLLLLASNDNYVSNSLCLVNSPHRQWAQVTHWGSRLVAEPFSWERFAIHRLDETPSKRLTLTWQFSPFVAPFFSWRSVFNPVATAIARSAQIQGEASPWPCLPTTSGVC